MEKAESANLAKTNFLNNMSHDIRTPMNVILGYNQMLGKRLTDPKLLDYQKKIEQSGNMLLSIINNVLDMARIESGRVELDEDYVKIIIDALDDENVSGHALSALENYKDEKYDKYFEPFLNDKRKWVVKIAERRLNK